MKNLGTANNIVVVTFYFWLCETNSKWHQDIYLHNLYYTSKASQVKCYTMGWNYTWSWIFLFMNCFGKSLWDVFKLHLRMMVLGTFQFGTVSNNYMYQHVQFRTKEKKYQKLYPISFKDGNKACREYYLYYYLLSTIFGLSKHSLSSYYFLFPHDFGRNVKTFWH